MFRGDKRGVDAFNELEEVGNGAAVCATRLLRDRLVVEAGRHMVVETARLRILTR